MRAKVLKVILVAKGKDSCNQCEQLISMVLRMISLD